MDNKQMATMLASIWRIESEKVKAILTCNVEVEEVMEALLCLHDGMEVDTVVENLKNGMTADNLMDERMRQRDVLMAQDKELQPERDEHTVEDISDFKLNEPNKMPEMSVEVTKKNDRQKNSRLLRLFYKFADKKKTDEQRYLEYAELISENMTEPQQLEVLNAINVGIPKKVIQNIVKRSQTPEVMRYMAATYMRMTRGIEI